jgi:serine/threonine-protein kinase TTK/MPS1
MNANNEIYAIKRVSLDKTDAETMSGYMNEIGLLKRLEGNNRIIQLFDSEVKAGPGGTKGHLMLVMECGEVDLAKLLQEQQKEPMNMVWISYYWQQVSQNTVMFFPITDVSEQMLQAVHVIHEEKIVHSDLKPANFVLVRGQLKLIDFGIANAIANDTTNIQRDHQASSASGICPSLLITFLSRSELLTTCPPKPLNFPTACGGSKLDEPVTSGPLGASSTRWFMVTRHSNIFLYIKR